MSSQDDFPDPMTVASRRAFADYVNRLREDLIASPMDWENVTLDSFLEALSAYAEDVPGYLNNAKVSLSADAPSWQLFALILGGASRYE